MALLTRGLVTTRALVARWLVLGLTLRVMVAGCIGQGDAVLRRGRGSSEALGRHALHRLSCLLLADKVVDGCQWSSKGYLKFSFTVGETLHLLLMREGSTDRHVQRVPVLGCSLVAFAPNNRQQALLNLLFSSKLKSSHATNDVQVQWFRQRTSLWAVAGLRKVVRLVHPGMGQNLGHGCTLAGDRNKHTG